MTDGDRRAAGQGAAVVRLLHKRRLWRAGQLQRERNIVHALVVINGNCAATTAQLPDVQYRWCAFWAHSGLGWSQANVNVLTQNPPATSDDFAGFPLMHFSDPISCVPISACYPTLRTEDG